VIAAPASGPRLVCPECGHRQDAGERCASCGYTDGLLSLDNAVHCELMHDIDVRRADKHEKSMRILSVVIAMAIVFTLWFVPGYWEYEQRVALPFLFDQWGVMIVIGFTLTLIFKRARPRKLFPYIQ
jgi:hypothetical protein